MRGSSLAKPSLSSIPCYGLSGGLGRDTGRNSIINYDTILNFPVRRLDRRSRLDVLRPIDTRSLGKWWDKIQKSL